jgi:hypothetical protein
MAALRYGWRRIRDQHRLTGGDAAARHVMAQHGPRPHAMQSPSRLILDFAP